MTVNKELVNQLINSCSGATFSSSSEGDVVIADIVDYSQWNQGIPGLLPLLGRIVYEEYQNGSKDGPYDESDPAAQRKAAHQLDLSLKGVNRFIAIVNSVGVAGYASLECYEGKETVFIRDVLADKGFRGTGVGPKLYRQILAGEGTSSIISYSRTPQAVALRARVGQEWGKKTFFGDMETERTEVADLQKLVLKHIKDEGILADALPDVPVPAGFACLKRGEDTLTPLKPEEVKFPRSHPFCPVFQRLLDLQNLLHLQNAYPGYTAVGLLVTVPR